MVLSSLEGEVASNMVHNARLNRSLGQEKDKDGLIEISKEIYDKLLSLPPQKGKVDLLALIQNNNLFYITGKGRAVFLLRKSAMITSKRKASKKYELDWKDYRLHPNRPDPKPALPSDQPDFVGAQDEEIKVDE